jgi:hypothetical protein
MTICASVKVRDGLVLGTDSMTQIWAEDQDGNRRPVKNYSNARKLFQIDELPIGVMTYGLGNIGPRSIHGFLRDFSTDYEGEDSVEAVSANLHQFIGEAYREQFEEGPKPNLGFFVAGYSPGEYFPEEREFLLPRDSDVRLVRPLEGFGASWRGANIPFTRLYKGFDPRALDNIKGMDGTEEVVEELQKYESPVVYDGMPVQDAIDFAIFILQTTIGLSTFEVAFPSPICGGPLQIATVLPEEGFRWIAKPSLSAQAGSY